MKRLLALTAAVLLAIASSATAGPLRPRGGGCAGETCQQPVATSASSGGCIGPRQAVRGRFFRWIGSRCHR